MLSGYQLPADIKVGTEHHFISFIWHFVLLPVVPDRQKVKIEFNFYRFLQFFLLQILVNHAVDWWPFACFPKCISLIQQFFFFKSLIFLSASMGPACLSVVTLEGHSGHTHPRHTFQRLSSHLSLFTILQSCPFLSFHSTHCPEHSTCNKTYFFPHIWYQTKINHRVISAHFVFYL